jgi:hypothetical protein
MNIILFRFYLHFALNAGMDLLFFLLFCRDKDSEGNMAYSKCEMYNVTGPLVGSGNVTDLSIIGKVNGFYIM